MNLYLILGLFALSLTTAGSLIWVARWAESRVVEKFPARVPSSSSVKRPETWLVFQNDMLMDGSPKGLSLAGVSLEKGISLARFSTQLSAVFGGLEAALETIPEQKCAIIDAHDGLQTMTIEQVDDRLLIDIKQTTTRPTAPEPTKTSPAELEALDLELESLRSAAHLAACPIWRCDPDGEISWANTAYLDLVAEFQPDKTVQVWPPVRLFPDIDEAGEQNGMVRVSLTLPGTRTNRWFGLQCQSTGASTLYTAIPIDAAVRAEQSLSEFTQTLTKTFAHLPTGLAIFDRERRLSLFNPALTELTTIRPEFLARRPGLHAFLDKLRDKRMIPEPRDYRSWRHHIYTLEVEAKNGTYDENWALPNGKTFKVTGQPHPNGAIAFMFDDISAGISLVRSHRAEVDLFQSVLDDIPVAVALFSTAGTLMLANRAYRTDWCNHDDPETADVSLVDATRKWASLCTASPIWGDIREYVGTIADRAEWAGTVRRRDGLLVQCKVTPLSSGATMIAFVSAMAGRAAFPLASAQNQISLPPNHASIL